MPVTIGGSGPITGVTSINTTVSDTELGYLDGVTSALQTQLAGKADTTGNGAWTAWTPSWSGLSVGNGTVTASYVRLGKTVHAQLKLVFGSTTSVSGDVSFTLPVDKLADATPVGGYVGLLDTGSALNIGTFNPVSGAGANYITIRALRVSGSNVIASAMSSTIPHTWASTDEIHVSLTYQAA